MRSASVGVLAFAYALVDREKKVLLQGSVFVVYNQSFNEGHCCLYHGVFIDTKIIFFLFFVPTTLHFKCE